MTRRYATPFATLTLAAITAVIALAAACGDAPTEDPTPQPGTPAYTTKIEDAPIDGLDVLTLEKFPPEYNLRILSGLPSGCALFDKAEESGRSGNTITVRVTNTMPDDPYTACTQIYGTKETFLSLGSDFTPGATYTVNVNDKTVEFTAQ